MEGKFFYQFSVDGIPGNANLFNRIIFKSVHQGMIGCRAEDEIFNSGGQDPTGIQDINVEGSEALFELYIGGFWDQLLMLQFLSQHLTNPDVFFIVPGHHHHIISGGKVQLPVCLR